MWLLVSLFAALSASLAYLLFPNHRRKYKTGFLALMLSGLALMVLVDRAFALASGEPMAPLSAEGIVENSAVLGFLMLAPIFIIWGISVGMSLASQNPQARN
ncbi:MAG: hypothetical protein N3F07_02840 [Candidatus Micrarchaeota archaeon]|nr:hypothetical protein [Candidatus Micrarchaeota archaeon]